MTQFGIFLKIVMIGFYCFLLVGSSFHDEKSAEICGKSDWYKKYIQRHNDMLAGKIEPKFLISFPVKAGMADMILGYVSGFVWALLTNRVHLILRVDNIDGKCNQRSIEFGYDYRFTNWSSFAFDKTDYECMLAPYPETIPCVDTAESPSMVPITFSNGTLSNPIYTLRHMRQVNSGYRIEFKDHNMAEYPQGFHFANILMFSTNWGVSYNAFNNPYHRDNLAAMGFSNENLFPCLFEFLFKIKPNVCVEGCKQVEQKLHALGKSEPKTLRIGIQVRQEDATEAPEHFACADMIAAEAAQRGWKSVYLLVTASQALQKSMSSKYGDKLLLPAGKVSGVKGVHRYEPDDITAEECKRKAEWDREAIVESARDMHLLSLVDVNIFSSSSGFGVVSALMKPKHNHTLFRINIEDHTHPFRLCHLDASDTVFQMADAWSGL